MLNNPNNSKVVIEKGSIGHTLEDIEVKHEPEFSVVDNIAFVNHLMNSDTNWAQIFHVSGKQNAKVTSKMDFIELSKRKEKLKKTEKRKRQQDFTDQYELETNFSNDLKDLKRKFEKSDENIRPIDLPKEHLEGLIKTTKPY